MLQLTFSKVLCLDCDPQNLRICRVHANPTRTDTAYADPPPVRLLLTLAEILKQSWKVSIRADVQSALTLTVVENNSQALSQEISHFHVDFRLVSSKAVRDLVYRIFDFVWCQIINITNEIWIFDPLNYLANILTDVAARLNINDVRDLFGCSGIVG